MRSWQSPSLRRSFMALVGALITFSLVSVPTVANHPWGTYHWKGDTAGTRHFTVVDNVSGNWDTRLDQTEIDWENPNMVVSNQYNLWASGALALRDYPTGGADAPPSSWSGTPPVTMDVVDGTPGSTCSPVTGTIQVCAANYGSNGWMGLAQIWVSQKHITQATAKMNDYYFTPAYYTHFGDRAGAALAADQQLVMCQELAHGFGLDHNDETFGNTNTGTCMDYGNTPWGDEHPNYHDYDQLAEIYAHPDATSTKGGGKKGAAANEPASERALGNNPKDWGQVTEYDGKGRPSHFRKDLGEGREVFTFIIYADHASGVEVGPGQAEGGHADGGGHSHDATAETGGHSHADDQGKKADGKRAGGKKADGKRDGKKAANKSHR